MNQTSKDTNLNWFETPLGEVLVKYGVVYFDGTNLLDLLDEYNPHYSPFIFSKYPKHLSGVDATQLGVFNSTVKTPRVISQEVDCFRPVYQFDLTRPVNPQLKRLKQTLNNAQLVYMATQGKQTKKIVSKSIVWLYPFYLRVLDADAAHVYKSEICENLSLDYTNGVGDDTFRNWKTEAQRLRDHGYLGIVNSPTP